MTPGKYSSPLLLIGGGADAVPVRYAARFTAPDPFLFLAAGGKRHVLVSMLELGRARRAAVPLICHTPDSLDLSPKNRRDLGGQALGLIRHLGLKRVYVSSQCPIGVVRRLEEGGVQVRVATEPVFPARLRKSDVEIQALRASQRAAVRAMKFAIDEIAASHIGEGDVLIATDGTPLTSESLRAGIEQILLEEQCSGDEIIVAGGDQGVDPHERGRGPLYAHQTIVLDIFPCSRTTGYWGDISRTVLRGKATAEQKALYQTVLDAQKVALDKVAPGVTGREIHQGICEAFEKAGYKTGMLDGVPQGFIHSTGHGVGLDIHEGPSVSPSGGALQEGNVITIEPGLYYKGIGGVRIEDTVVVTAEGCSLLGRCRKELEV
jgi:Xaa-Pro aminopeptidase